MRSQFDLLLDDLDTLYGRREAVAEIKRSAAEARRSHAEFTKSMRASTAELEKLRRQTDTMAKAARHGARQSAAARLQGILKRLDVAIAAGTVTAEQAARIENRAYHEARREGFI